MFPRAYRVAGALLLAGQAMGLPLDGPAPKEKSAPVARPGELPGLVAQLGAPDWQEREKAMRALIALGEPARPALRDALRSLDPEVRWRAAYALSLVDFELLPTQPDAARALYASAARARAQPGGAEAARELYAEVVKRFPETRWAAAARERLEALKAQEAAKGPPPGPEAIAALVARLGHAAWAERQEASRQLAQAGEAAREALEAAARAADPEAAWRARQLLRRLDNAQPPDPQHDGPSPRVRLMTEVLGQAARTKTRPAEPDDLDALVRALAGESPAETARAREVLLNIGQEALPALFRALEACDEPAGVEIMDLLRQITREELGFDPARWLAWWRARQVRGTP